MGASLSHALVGFLVEYPRLLHIGVPITGATGLGKQVGSEIGKVGKLNQTTTVINNNLSVYDGLRLFVHLV